MGYTGGWVGGCYTGGNVGSRVVVVVVVVGGGVGRGNHVSHDIKERMNRFKLSWVVL